MATIKAVVIKVDKFNDGKQIKLSVDKEFTTLKEGVETNVKSFNFNNVELQVLLKKFNPIFRRIELFCMGDRCKPQLFKLLLEGSKIEIEQVLHKAGELRQSGEPATFDYYEDVINNITLPKLDKEALSDLKSLMVNPKLEKPSEQPLDNDALLALLYNK